MSVHISIRMSVRMSMHTPIRISIHISVHMSVHTLLKRGQCTHVYTHYTHVRTYGFTGLALQAWRTKVRAKINYNGSIYEVHA